MDGGRTGLPFGKRRSLSPLEPRGFRISSHWPGPVEVNETYIGGKEANKHEYKKQRKGRGPVGKAAVVGAKDRETNQVTAMPVALAKGVRVVNEYPGKGTVVLIRPAQTFYERIMVVLSRTARAPLWHDQPHTTRKIIGGAEPAMPDLRQKATS